VRGRAGHSNWPCCDVGSKRILWVKVNLNFDTLFRLMDGLRADTGRRYSISEQYIEENTCDMEDDMRHTVTEVEIALPMSHNTLTSAEEYVK
jgi:hypothetical protein